MMTSLVHTNQVAILLHFSSKSEFFGLFHLQLYFPQKKITFVHCSIVHLLFSWHQDRRFFLLTSRTISFFFIDLFLNPLSCNFLRIVLFDKICFFSFIKLLTYRLKAVSPIRFHYSFQMTFTSLTQKTRPSIALTIFHAFPFFKSFDYTICCGIWYRQQSRYFDNSMSILV